MVMMTYAMGAKFTSQYQRSDTEMIADPSPYQLILMLMTGAMDRVARAKGAMEHKVIEEKGLRIGQAISIIGGLRESLDMEKGGELAVNLDSLYDYMQQRLLEANIKNDLSLLDEVSRLMGTIKSGWEEIPPELRIGVAR